jgi:hypothetical protein
MVSQLTGFVIGTAMNAVGGGDNATVQELLRGVSGANTTADIDCREAKLKIDRGKVVRVMLHASHCTYYTDHLPT